jgi:UDP-N-acetylmuramate dehydrogenase
MPYYLLGGGSNVLIADAGIRGLVIYNRCRQVRVDAAPCCVFPVDDRPFLFAESGVELAGLARQSVAEGLTGLEWAVSVPGTVGGAVVNNAGAHGGEVKDNLYDAMVLDGRRNPRKFRRASWTTPTDSSSLKRRLAVRHKAGFGPVVLSVNFRLAGGDAAAIRAQADAYLAASPAHTADGAEPGQHLQVNPPGDYAGRLIEAAGLKGAAVGGLQVSRAARQFYDQPGRRGQRHRRRCGRADRTDATDGANHSSACTWSRKCRWWVSGERADELSGRRPLWRAQQRT